MNRGAVEPIKSIFSGHRVMFAAFMGGGGASNGTLAGNGVLEDTAGKFPKAANIGTTLTYNSSTGLYLMVYSQQVKHVLYADGIVVDSGSSPTAALKCTVTSIVPTTRTIGLRIHAPNGTLTDLSTSDMLIMRLECADTSSIGTSPIG